MIHISQQLKSLAGAGLQVACTRAGNTATRINEKGLVEVVRANTPRFDYDPITLACRGVLREMVSTNILLNNQALTAAGWTIDNIIVTPNAGIAPDGTLTAFRITRKAAPAFSWSGFNQAIAGQNPAGKTYAGSVWIKSETNSLVNGSLLISDVNTTTYTLAIQATSAWARAFFISAGPFNNAGGGNIGLGVHPTTDGDSFLIWAPMLENSLELTSTILTAGAAVARNAEILVINGLASLPIGSIFTEAKWDRTTPGLTRLFFKFTDAGDSNQITHRIEDPLAAGGNPTAALRVFNAGVDQAFFASGISVPNALVRQASRFRVNDFAQSLNGAAVVTDVAGSVPAALDRLFLGSNSDGTSALNGWLRYVELHSKVFTNAELQTKAGGGSVDSQPLISLDLTKTAVESETGSLKLPRIGYHTYTRDRAAVNVTTSTDAVGSVKDAPLRPDTHEYWLATAGPATWRLDLGSAKEWNYLAIGAHTIGSSLATLKVQYSDDGATWGDVTEEFAPADDGPIVIVFPKHTHRYAGLWVSGVARVGPIHVGSVLTMPRTIYGGHMPITLSRQTVLTQVLSRGGAFLGQTYKRNGLRTSTSFRLLTAAWYRANFDPFVKEARKYPYFIAWRPSEFPSELAYGWTPVDIAPSNSGKKDFMQVSFDTIGLGNAQ